ncbi:MAG: 2TM domain-containing protein [Pseudomonadota bacterium]|nr:2TM domain-containing protein [Pseudomonadota bacterium]
MDRTLSASDDERLLERRARRRVGTKMGFYIHALVFVLVNLGLFAINSYTGGERWAIFPLLGWGLGLAIHGIVTFVSLQGDGLRSRMLQSEMDRLRQRR